jgi:hypothetical protein
MAFRSMQSKYSMLRGRRLISDYSAMRIVERFTRNGPNHHRVVWLVRKGSTPSECSPPFKISFQTRAVAPRIGLYELFWKPAILKQVRQTLLRPAAAIYRNFVNPH